MTNSTVNDLLEFIKIAEKNRKYPTNTASGLKAALRLFNVELNEQERESIDVFESNIEQIFKNVYQKNKSKMTDSTLGIYKKRVYKIIDDYRKYGSEPGKMSSWYPTARAIKKSNSKVVKDKEKISDDSSLRYSESNIAMVRFELPLRPDVKAIILTPSDITKDEVTKVKKYIEYLESMTT